MARPASHSSGAVKNKAHCIVLFMVASLAAGCGKDADESTTVDEPLPGSSLERLNIPKATTVDSLGGIRFVDITAESGIQFQWQGGPTNRHCMPEQNGGGVAILDYDHDGVPDLALSDCGTFDGNGPRAVDSFHLFKGSTGLTFQSVSHTARVSERASSMGLSAGDFDGDGFTDVFVAAYGENLLFHNCGDGTFENVTDESAIDGKHWSTSAAFADLNGDGHLDLYVVNYVDWTPDFVPCHNSNNPDLLQICSPTLFNSQPDQLFLSNGDGTFKEVGKTFGIANVGSANGLAIEIADLTDDGLLDVFVANDVGLNSLYRNTGADRFDDIGLLSGVAVSSDGAYGASMGTACADYNRDGQLDLFVTNFRSQVNDLYSGIGEGGFVHTNSDTGIDLLSRNRLAFGAVLSDFDLDGWPDLFVANGHIWDLTSVDPQIEYEMAADILRNVEGNRFRDVSRTAGPFFSQKYLARAVAAGDLDNNGTTDLVIQNVGSPAVILRNDSDLAGGSTRVEFIGVQSSRQPLGCRVDVRLVDGLKITTHVPAGGSFQASHDPRIVVPTRDSRVEQISITWPTGTSETWTKIPAEQSVVLIEGTGHRSELN